MHAKSNSACCGLLVEGRLCPGRPGGDFFNRVLVPYSDRWSPFVIGPRHLSSPSPSSMRFRNYEDIDDKKRDADSTAPHLCAFFTSTLS